MRELSLNVLDIAQNSIAAGASVITMTVEEDAGADRLTLSVEDNGCGMTSEQLERVRDPVLHHRTTRPVGMGIPCSAWRRRPPAARFPSRLSRGPAPP